MNAVMMNTEPYKPIKTKRTFEEISRRIKELIFEGVLKPGEKLPSENGLAKRFQVGRQSVREALRLLELSGFITVQKGVNGGPIIENTMLNKMASMFLDTFKFNRIPIKDLTTARTEIEKLILKMAIENADKSDIREIEANIKKAKAKQKQGVPAFEENTDFHRLLAKASRNHVFVMVMESILAVESDFRSKFKKVDLQKSIIITQYHGQILDALISDDYDRAQRTHESLVRETHSMFRSDPLTKEKKEVSPHLMLN